MNIIKTFLYILFIVSLFSNSCCHKGKRQTRQVVKEWIGKEIIFPEDVACSFMGIDTVWSDRFFKPYKILFYADSIGCTSCKLKLFEWKKIISEVDTSLRDKVDFLFYFQPKNEKSINRLLKNYLFKYPVFIDIKNRINQLNNFPVNRDFQCFLLDRNNRVILVGNPTFGYKIWELYKEEIRGKREEKNENTTVEIVNPKIKMKSMKCGQSYRVYFTLKNIGKKPFIIYDIKTSCGCLLPSWAKKPIPVDEDIKIEVLVTPEDIGYMHRKIEIYGNIREKSISLIIEGEVI